MKKDFGKHKGQALESVPNQYLGWLSKWDVGHYCSCENVECDDDCVSRPAKLRRVTRTTCNAWIWVNGERVACDCHTCDSLKFLETKPDVVAAARDLVTQRRLCCHCWKVMPSVGDSRVNGKAHNDWHNRYLHKKCWRELQDR